MSNKSSLQISFVIWSPGSHYYVPHNDRNRADTSTKQSWNHFPSSTLLFANAVYDHYQAT